MREVKKKKSCKQNRLLQQLKHHFLRKKPNTNILHFTPFQLTHMTDISTVLFTTVLQLFLNFFYHVYPSVYLVQYCILNSIGCRAPNDDKYGTKNAAVSCSGKVSKVQQLLDTRTRSVLPLTWVN